MFSLFSNVDRLLRGHFTRGEDLGAGRIAVPARTLVLVGLVLGAAYGAFMGLYGALRPGYATPLSILASAVKVPLLFLLKQEMTKVPLGLRWRAEEVAPELPKVAVKLVLLLRLTLRTAPGPN